ncbi:hypothetical protein L208DRAFT_1400539 [Tricholoma matsutake]|nr:hypothetical protein L208DRAFT_1400539 [Tricholoma matsutake 945]
MEHKILGIAWEEACQHIRLDLPMLTPSIAKLITSRGSHLRGELKTKTRPLVETFYGFKSGHNRKIIVKNCQIAEELKDGHTFVYKITHAELVEHKGLYQSNLIQKVINAMWFRNKQDEGITYSSYFNPFTIPALALVLMAIECCIDEWITGIKTDIPFTTALYQDVYEDHICCLQHFKKHTGKHDILTNILLKIYNRGRFHSGAQPLSMADCPTISDDAFAAALKQYIEESETETNGEHGDSD